MKNKKVYILTSVHPVFDTRIFYKEAKTLVGAGYDVTLIAQHNKNEIVDGIKIIALSEPRNRFWRILFLAKRAYKLALKQKADIYHFHDPELLPWAIKLKRKTGAKIIYDVHENVAKDILSKDWIPKFIRFTVAKFFDYFQKRISKKFDYIITATPGIKNNFKQPNIIDIKNYPLVLGSEFTGKQNEFRKNNNVYTLIYIGGLTQIRGIKEIVQSLKFINSKYPVKLKLIGKFDKKNFEKEIKNIEESEKIEFLGKRPLEECFLHLKMADIGLICFWPEPNHIEAVPNKLFEYMTAGLPIIASNFPLWEKIVEKNNLGITVNPLNPREIARAIEYLIEHREEAKKMGENGREAVLEKYNWENESKKLLEVYKKL
jgi:glycosyltransferase involved in cell wall biosynthesis